MKKLFALMLAVCMLMTLSVSVFADEYDTVGEKGMTVTYSVAPSYTVTIPPDVTIGADGTEKIVTAEGVVVKKGQCVSVSLAADNDFTVSTPEGATLTYTVTANGAAVAPGGEILLVNPEDADSGVTSLVFSIDENAIQFAGTYTGTATFTVAVIDASAP